MIGRLVRGDPATAAWAVVTAGSLGRLVLGFAASVVVARGLGAADFGVYALLGGLAGVAGLLGDPGLTPAGVKRVAEAWPGRPATARERAAAFFWLRLAAMAGVVGGGGVLAAPLARVALGHPGLGVLVALTFVGVGATAASGAVATLLQATDRFGRLSLVLLANSALTALLALALLVGGWLTLVSAVLVLGIGTSLLSLALGVRFLPWSGPGLPVPSPRALRAEATALLRFGRWLWVADLLGSLAARLDVFLVNLWAGPAAVGAYALALNLAAKADVVNHSLYTVLLPRAAAHAGTVGYHAYARASLRRSALIALAFVPLFPLAGPLITLFYGPAYHEAIGPFRLLLAIVLFDVVATPLTLLAFSAERPGLLAAADALRVAVLVLVGVGLIPSLGPLGAVAARAASRVAGAALVLGALAVSRARDHSATVLVHRVD